MAALSDRPAMRAPRAVDHRGGVLDRLAGRGLEQRVAGLAAAQRGPARVEGDRLGGRRADVDADDHRRRALRSRVAHVRR
jgi:hypothetical protein